MKNDLSDPARYTAKWLQRPVDSWNRFWFTPADPTLLGVMRFFCGLITCYTLFIYGFALQEFMGEKAWLDLPTRLDSIRNRAVTIPALSGDEGTASNPQTPEQQTYVELYHSHWGDYPPAPFPRTDEEANYCHNFRQRFGFDLRNYGLPIPTTAEEHAYLERYATLWKQPPPAYPKDANEAQQIDDYIQRHGADPRRIYAKGTPVWSIWFYVTDPTSMAIVHWTLVGVAFLCAIGFCSRITTFVTWMANLWYIHRNPTGLFGVDTISTIILFYLMIGPSGGGFSVDRLIARWWSASRLHIINRWRGLWHKPALIAEGKARPHSAAPIPTVGANVAYRMLQVHLCIIYFISGTSKLQGGAWWNGMAVFGTLANMEFAPMYNSFYLGTLRALARYAWIFDLTMTVSTFFTLAFEISYPYLVWRPKTRWVILSGAILLHGFIGLFMGLKTFSLMMLVFNMAFLTSGEIHWVLNIFRRKQKPLPIPDRADKRIKAASTAIR